MKAPDWWKKAEKEYEENPPSPVETAFLLGSLITFLGILFLL